MQFFLLPTPPPPGILRWYKPMQVYWPQEGNKRLTLMTFHVVRQIVPSCFHYNCRNLPKGERSHPTHWALKTVAVMIPSLTRTEQTDLSHGSRLVSWPSHAVHYHPAATSPRSSPGMSYFLRYLRFCSSFFLWLESHSLTLCRGKPHPCFKVQFKYHFPSGAGSISSQPTEATLASFPLDFYDPIFTCPHWDYSVSKLSQSDLSHRYLLLASLQT